MKKLYTGAAIVALGFAVSGCATVINGTTQSVAVNTTPVDGAMCALTNSQGTWYVTTPGTVEVHKTKTDLMIDCTKDGYSEAKADIAPTFQATTVGNVLAGGIIGVAVDAASGANYEYPSPIAVPMSNGTAPVASAPAPTQVDDTIPQS